MRREDVGRLRRSIALSPALPADQAALLLDEVERLLAREQRLDALIEELRGVFPELRRVLNEIAATSDGAGREGGLRSSGASR